MSTVKINSANPSANINAIASKSVAHRLLICASFADKPSIIRCETLNKDIMATVSCLISIGAKIEYTCGKFYVEPVKYVNYGSILDCNESGSTLRFLIPVVCALGGNWSFKMSGRLPERPLSPLKEELEAHGISFSYPAHDILSCSGKLSEGEYIINGGVSSQFVSGLLFALSLINGESRLTITGDIESLPYIEMTLDALGKFGANIKKCDNKFIISEKILLSPGELYVEGDWSGAAFPLCAGALSEIGVCVKGLDLNSRQGDMKIISILKEFGAEIKVDENGITVKKGDLNGIKIDAKQIPDLVPVLAVIASVAKGRTEIYGASRLRIKESDRLMTTASFLTSLGADIKENDDGLIINGRHKLSGGTVDSFNDHRIAMSAAVASAACQSAVTVTNADAVSKSYPNFWKDFSTIGYDIEFIN